MTDTGPAASAAAPLTPIDPLWIDLYPGDYNGFPPLERLTAWEPAVGIGLKTSEGTTYRPPWFIKTWPALRRAQGDRYGVDRFRQPYLFLRFDTLGALQADFALKTVELAGGWGAGDLGFAVDAELGGPKHPNRSASRQQIIDCVSSCVERLIAERNQPVVLYGIGVLRDFQIKSSLGCDYLWAANYEDHLPYSEYHDLGWIYDRRPVTQDIDRKRRLFAWQYCGSPEGANPAMVAKGYPVTCPGTLQATLDLSAVEIPDLRALCAERVTTPAP